MDIEKLEAHSRSVRRKILDMGVKGQGGHLAPGFSCTDILVALYDDILKFDPKNLKSEDRDRFILSKGHGCMPLYILLSENGFFPEKTLDTFCKPGSVLGCHADRNIVPGIEASTGSLGLGLSVAVGMALSAKHDKKDHRVYALLGDGEMQEGTIWEGLMYAGSNKLDNLTVIVDYNGYGATARLEDTSNVAPLADKLKAFNFNTKKIDGHNFSEILPALRNVPYQKGKPSAIVAYTTKGKGVGFMEEAFANGDPKWHYQVPSGDEILRARKDLEGRT